MAITDSLSHTESSISASQTSRSIKVSSISSSLTSTTHPTSSAKVSSLSSSKSSSTSTLVPTISSSRLSLTLITSGSSISSSFSSLSTRIQVVSSSSSTVSSSATAAPTLQNKPVVGSYNYYQCRTEGTGVRALSGAASANDLMTVEMCATSCAGYTYFGTEYGRECYCGNSFGAGSTVAPTNDCSFTCGGDAYEYCGAGMSQSTEVGATLT